MTTQQTTIPDSALPADNDVHRVGNGLPIVGSSEVTVRYDKMFEFIKQACKEAIAEHVSASQQDEGDCWMGSRETARYLGLSEKAVRSGATNGDIPGHKYPKGSSRGRGRFKKSELDRKMKAKPKKQITESELSIW